MGEEKEEQGGYRRENTGIKLDYDPRGLPHYYILNQMLQ